MDLLENKLKIIEIRWDNQFGENTTRDIYD